MEEELIDRQITEEEITPKYSGKFQLIFHDGKVQYDGEIGEVTDFPLTEAELYEYEVTINEYKTNNI